MNTNVVLSVEMECREGNAETSRPIIPASRENIQDVLKPESELPLIPMVGQWVQAGDLLSDSKLDIIKKASKGWTDIRAMVTSVDYKRASNDFRVEIIVLCVK